MNNDLFINTPKLILEKKYWLNKLTGIPATLRFPVDFTGNETTTWKPDTAPFQIPQESAAKIIKIGRKSDFKIFSLLTSVLNALLHRYDYKNASNILVWAPTIKEKDGNGYLNTHLAIRTLVESRMSFKELVIYVDKTIAEAYKNANFPFEKIPGALGIEKNNVLAVLSDIGITFENIQDSIDHLQCNILFSFVMDGEQIHGTAKYNGSLYRKETIERYCHHFLRVLTGAVDNLDTLISDLPLLGDEEKQQLLVDLNNTDHALEDIPLQGLFYRQAEKTPGAIAIIHKDQKISYRLLKETSNRLAHTLRNKGVTPNTVVTLLIERSHNMVSGMLAVLIAGGAYLPIEPDAPGQRVQNIVAESKTRYILTQKIFLNKINGDIQVIDIEDKNSYSHHYANLDIVNTSGDLFNVIFTSGSTGVPKGVKISHLGIMNYVNWRTRTLNYSGNPVSLQLISYAFDGFASNLYPELVTGGGVLITDEKESLDFPLIKQLIREHQVTHMSMVPSMYKALLLSSSPGELDTLRFIVIAGDKTTGELLSLSHKVNPGLLLVNEYGPTENSVATTAYLGMKPGMRISVGSPIYNNRVYILAEDRTLLPRGAAGELFISGSSLSQGYLNQPQLTLEKFIPNPFNPGQTMYRSGDLTRWLPDGNIELLGRIDRQIKIRGLRIELEEIENLLLAHNSIGEAVVSTRGDTDEKKSIYAYYVEKKNLPEAAGMAGKEMELWPSMAEFFVYDEMLYYALTHDERRNDRYKIAIHRLVKDKIVLDVGTGQDAILARFCLEGGAKKVYAVDIVERSAQKAQKTVKDLGLEDRIIVIHGDATTLALPEKVDVCISEIVGPIGGSEGAALILNRVKRLMKEGARMIPERSLTKIAAVCLPDPLHEKPVFHKLPAVFTEKIFTHFGFKFDLRILVKNFPPSHIISNHEIFEDLFFDRTMPEEYIHNLTLTIDKNQRLDGFLLWLNLFTLGDVVIDILDAGYSWQPVFVPAFYPGVRVSVGDVINMTCTRTLCRDNHVNPDYKIEGVLIRKGAGNLRFEYALPNFEKSFKKNPFYQELFANDLINTSTEDDSITREDLELTPGKLREYLGQYLPDYMIPSHFVKLDEIPLYPNGKINRSALPEPDRARKSGEKYEAPRNELQQKLADLWSHLLDVEVKELSIYDTFFDAGGNSLLMMELTNEINKRCNTGIKIIDLFSYNTIAQIAELVESKKETKPEDEQIVKFSL